MKKTLDQHFSENFFCYVVYFQLRSVDLPDDFEKSIANTEV